MAMLRSGGDLEVTGFLTIGHVTFHPSRTTPIDFILVILSSPGQAYYFGIQKVSLRPQAYFLVRLFQFLPPPP